MVQRVIERFHCYTGKFEQCELFFKTYYTIKTICYKGLGFQSSRVKGVSQ